MQQARQLGGRAIGLMKRDIDKARKRVRQISMLAMSGSGWDGGARGVYSKERDELRDMSDYLGDIRKRALEYRTVALKLEQTGQKCDSIVAEATDVMDDAANLA